jgi:hypothetical protein
MPLSKSDYLKIVAIVIAVIVTIGIIEFAYGYYVVGPRAIDEAYEKSKNELQNWWTREGIKNGVDINQYHAMQNELATTYGKPIPYPSTTLSPEDKARIDEWLNRTPTPTPPPTPTPTAEPTTPSPTPSPTPVPRPFVISLENITLRISYIGDRPIQELGIHVCNETRDQFPLYANDDSGMWFENVEQGWTTTIELSYVPKSALMNTIIVEVIISNPGISSTDTYQVG